MVRPVLCCCDDVSCLEGSTPLLHSHSPGCTGINLTMACVLISSPLCMLLCVYWDVCSSNGVQFIFMHECVGVCMILTDYCVRFQYVRVSGCPFTNVWCVACKCALCLCVRVCVCAAYSAGFCLSCRQPLLGAAH